MAEHKTVAEKIDLLFEAHAQDRPENVRFFVEHLHSNYETASRRLTRSIVLLLTIWLVSVMIGYDAVAEAEFSALKLKNARLLLLLAPPLLGAVGHQLCSNIVLLPILWQALGRCYKHLLPKAYEHDLEDLVAPPNFFDTTRLLLGGFTSEKRDVWFVIICIVIVMLPLVLIGHIGYLLWIQPAFAMWISMLSLIVGLVVWGHGAFLLAGGVMFSEGRD